MVVHIFDLMLEIFNDILNVSFGLCDALCIVFDQIGHNLQHVLFVCLLVHIVELLHLYQALEVVISILEFNNSQEIVLLEGWRVLLGVNCRLGGGLSWRLL
jgi:hypothetical protein